MRRAAYTMREAPETYVPVEVPELDEVVPPGQLEDDSRKHMLFIVSQQ
jgi:hypothetical protein